MKYFFLFILLVAVTQLNAQTCTHRLSGHVHNSATHENLERAYVTIVELNRSIITNNRGDFQFDSLCSGSYTLMVSHVNHEPFMQVIQLDASRHFDIDLPVLQNPLAGVTVSAQRGHLQTGIKRELSGRELEETRGQTLAEALSRLNGVSMLQTGSNIAKPVIHGLHGNRVLTINNGVRQEGQQWGNEHAPEVDPFIANRLTVIKGVEELRYGSDAIGGVILIDPRPLRNRPGYSAEFNSVYFSNNRQFVFSGIYEQQVSSLPHLSWRVQGTYKRGANATTPDYRLNNTGMEEKNFSLTGGWSKNRFSSELYYSYFNTRLGIFSGAHIGNLTDLERAISSERPDPVFTGEQTYRIDRPYQHVIHHLLKSRSVFQVNAANRISLLLAGQYNDRQEFDVVRNTNTRAPQLDLGIFTATEELTWDQQVSQRLNRTTGIVALQQKNTYAGRYFIPAYRSYNWGAYHIERWNTAGWDAQAGIRVDHRSIYTNRITSGGLVRENYSFDFTTLAGSFNLGHRFNEHWRMNATATLSNRAPHVNELLSNGIHHGTATYEEGNINLKPERSVNISWNSTYTSESGNAILEASLYRNSIRNFIFLQPKPDEPVLTISGAFPKMAYEQADALIQGIDLSGSFRLGKRLEWNNRYSLIRARNQSIGDWMIRMPSDRLQSEVVFSLPAKGKITNAYFSTEGIHVWEQTRVPDETNGKQDYKVPPPGYFLWNADFSATIQAGKLPLVIGLGLRNILNTRYREYLNSMRYFTDETGRNIQLRVRIPIQQNL